MLFSKDSQLSLTPKITPPLKPASFWISKNSHLLTLGTTSNNNWRVWDDIDDSIRDTHNSYYAIKSYEKRFEILSETMYEQWKRGEVSGPVYSDWVSEYMMVWDKIRARS